MNKRYCLLAITRADLLMRLRSPRFWIVLGLLALTTWSFFPTPEQHYLTATINQHYRARYSSAWIGMMLALMLSTLLVPAGFYVIRGTLTRDIETRVWQLLVTTTMTRRTYLMAKWCSHVLTLLLMAATCLITGLFMQWLRAEDRSIDLIELVKPLLILTLPVLGLTAAFAIWFDMLPFLRRTFGNLLFFIVWIASLSLGVADTDNWRGKDADANFGSEPAGMVVFLRDINRIVAPQLPGHSAQDFCLGCGEHGGAPVQTFVWQHWQPRLIDLPVRLLWLLAALAAVVAAAPLLDWSAARTIATVAADGKQQPRNRPLRWLTRLLGPLQSSLLGRIVSAELLLILRQRRILWWLAMFGFCLMQVLAAPQEAGIGVMLAWLMFLDVLARAALRDEESGTRELLFTAPGASRRILAARWLSQLGLLWLFTLPAMLRFAVSAPLTALAIIAVGASLASWGLALGALLRHARPYEVLFCVLLYHGIQGGNTLNATVTPSATALWHVALLPVAALLLLWRWPGMSARAWR